MLEVGFLIVGLYLGYLKFRKPGEKFIDWEQ